MQIYINRNATQFGPYSVEEINHYLDVGHLLPIDWAWYEGAVAWIPLLSIPGIKPRAVPPPGPPPRFLAPSSSIYAGFWLRVVATFIDGAVLFIPTVVYFALIAQMADPSDDPVKGFLGIVYVAVSWAYFAFAESSRWQATLGKKVLGLRVTDLHGNRISLARATGRYFSKLLSVLTFYIGFVLAAVTPRKQALEDMIAGTLVVKKLADVPSQVGSASGAQLRKVDLLSSERLRAAEYYKRLVQSKTWGKRLTVLAVLSLVTLLALVGLVALIVVGSNWDHGGDDGQHESGTAAVAAPVYPPPSGTWKWLLYDGKHAVYKNFPLPDYWHELDAPLDANADRAFVGPKGIVLSIYQYDDANLFWTTLHKAARFSAAPPKNLENGAHTFDITAKPVSGLRLRSVITATVSNHALAFSIRYPADLSPLVEQAAGFEMDYSIKVMQYYAKTGKVDTNDLETRRGSDSALLLELAKEDTASASATGSLGTNWSNLSRAQWKDRAAQNFPGFPMALQAQASRFQQVMGRPARSQTIGDQALWYYECSDGTIQLATDALTLQATGFMQAQVNDY